MFATSTNSLEFPKQVVLLFRDAVEAGTKQAYHVIWSSIQKLIVEHWLYAILLLIALFLVAVLNYAFTGRWAMLGSVMYNYLYGGALLLTAYFFGSDIFASDLFKIFLVILYIVCFTLVGKLLTVLGIRKRGY